jgi:acyl-CoA thioesterase FadM
MYRLRFLRIMLGCLISRTRPLLDTFEVSFVAIPFVDTDVTRLFTHAYSAYMALARWHYVFHSEFRNGALRHGWAPVTTAEMIDYKRSIKAFERVKVTSRLIGWNENRFFLEHTFTVRGETRAVCFVEGSLRGPKSVLKPAEAFAAMGAVAESPPLPDPWRKWIASRA